jgi:hypothetical protein
VSAASRAHTSFIDSRRTASGSTLPRVVGDWVEVDSTRSAQLSQYEVDSRSPVAALTNVQGAWVRSRQMTHVSSWSGSGTASSAAAACLHPPLTRQQWRQPLTPWHSSEHGRGGWQIWHAGSSEAGIGLPGSGTLARIANGRNSPVPGRIAGARKPVPGATAATAARGRRVPVPGTTAATAARGRRVPIGWSRRVPVGWGRRNLRIGGIQKGQNCGILDRHFFITCHERRRSCPIPQAVARAL